MKQTIKLNYSILAFIIFTNTLGWSLVLVNKSNIEKVAISTFQFTQLEIVRSVARSVSIYATREIKERGEGAVGEIESELFRYFVKPVRLLKQGDAWIHAPDHVVFDMSEDFPREYMGMSMSQIFAVQKGASHTDEMAKSVESAKEGIGWYIWLPEKGKEIAAWTPVKVDKQAWVIGLSTPLSEILEKTATFHNTLLSVILMGSVTVFSVLLYFGWNFTQKTILTKRAELEKEITERQQAESHIKTLLQEKDLLLKEVHHRIRNNMSTIKSLLKLQSSTLVNNPDAVNALKEAENRVQSMLVLYDKLFLTTDYVNISGKKYFETLIDEVIQNFSLKKIVYVEYDFEDVMLDGKTVFNLGIIVNELITNTMKHAFVGKEQGKINVSLSVDEGHANMTIQDDGTDLPESVSFENPSNGFGFKLVSMLVSQLDGSIQIERGEGTKFTIKFNIET